MIDGVIVKQLKVIPDDRGHLMEIIRSDDAFFERFGQVYMTTTYPNVVKAWHLHRLQTDHMCAVHGMFRVALYDARDDSPTRGEIQEIYMGSHRPVVLRIPPGVYHGWICVSQEEGIVVNMTDYPYNRDDPDEYRLPFDTGEIPYDWSRRMG
jgi:dTDP-4-dehydrorhamnose 3,5-epimerase